MNIEVALILSVSLNILFAVVILIILYKLVMSLKNRESSYYTDYKYKGTVLRIFKPQFEAEAIVGVPISKILDRGMLSQSYLWALIEI